MNDQEKTRDQLILELADVRRRLETSETEHEQIQEEIEQEMQESLHQSEEQYRLIFESIADSVLVGNLEGRIVAANPAACEMHGYTQEEIIDIPVLELIHPDDHQRFDEFLEVVETGAAPRITGPE